MTKCKRCELNYIHNGGSIENIREGKTWARSEDNVLWFVCDHCAEVLAYCYNALSCEDRKERLLRLRKAYLEGKKNE